MLQAFKIGLGGMLGVMAAQTLMFLYTCVFVGLGYFILVKFNKKGTKLLKDIQPMQYIGIILCILGMLPFLQYFIIGLLEGAGLKIADDLF